MTKKYKIKGIDCPNCVRKLEEQLNNIDSINSAKIDFIISKCKIKIY